ncbi:MAG: hypothetical protein N2510_00290 [Ignavibacteria bacterium]|nr:hypothetical protein [Ignavibacteria bacterium]
MSFKKDYINYLLHRLINSAENNLHNNQRVRNIAEKIISANDIVKITFLVGKTAGMEMLFKYLLYISDKIDKSQISIFNLKENFQYDLKNLEKIFSDISEYEAKTEDEIIKIDESNDLAETPETEITVEEKEPDVIQITEDIYEEEERDPLGNDESLTLIENRDYTSEVFELDSEGSEENLSEETEKVTSEQHEKLPDLEIEIRKTVLQDDGVKEETVTNEAYNRFETRFFEDVKILEKLFSSVERDCNSENKDRIKCLQSLTEIIGITSELSGLARQLSFDLIADIFHTMNMYFTKAISDPGVISSDRLKLFDSSLALVNSLIKNEDYLNYDYVIDKIERLKSEISSEEAEEVTKYVTEDDADGIKESGEKEETEVYESEEYISSDTKDISKSISEKQDPVNFKLRYLIKEFERIFKDISELSKEYDKYEAIERSAELNQVLRLIARIASSARMDDVLRLAEVTYVFLKYVRDYRMNLLETEIQQIIKYIIFTFKMLLTNRKPEDFNVLVQHLNNPVKIFTEG